MKKTTYPIILALAALPLLSAVGDNTPEITSFSPTTITPGETVLTIDGNNFGSPFNSPENQICFGADNCYDATGLNDYLQAWGDEQIQLLVPEDIGTDSDTIHLRVYLPDTETFGYIQSAETYTVQLPPDPEITSFSPTEFTPGETIVTINGSEFGDEYNSVVNEICFGQQNCIPADDMDTYIQSWSDTEIQVLVPDFVDEPDEIWIFLYTPSLEAYSYIKSEDQFTIAPEEGDDDTDDDVDDDTDDDADDDDTEPELNPEITSFSPVLIVQGETLLTILGTDFGESYVAGSNQICFDEACIADDDIDTYLQSWSDTEITLIVPETIENPGKIKLKLYSTAAGEYTFIESTDNYRLLPKITSFSPTELTAGETTLIISGYEFGDAYATGQNQICFENNGCIEDADLDTYLTSWSDTEIQVLVPEFVEEEGRISLLLQIPTSEEYGITYSETQFTLTALPDPEITSISPDTLVPGETNVTITGEGFGNSYVNGYNQICFNENCISDGNLNFYLQEWSDTEIIVKAPSFINDEDSGTIGLKVYFPRTGYYDFIESPEYTVGHKPVIEWYYRQMNQGDTYTYSGYYFGTSPGKVVINNLECDIVSWSNTDVTFTVPNNASSGDVYIESSQGIKSSTVYAIIISIDRYSDDEYSQYQWHLGTINIEDAWEITEGSEDVVVAVIDSGVDIDHEDLEHAIWENEDEIANNGIDDDNNGYVDDIHGWDFVLNSNSMSPRGEHGTMVSSVIAAQKDNSIGVAGIAPNVKIMPLNIANYDGYTVSVDAALMATKYAVDNGADIINMSFGGLDSLTYYEDVIQYAYDNNVFVVAATGNEGADLDYYTSYAPVCVDVSKNAVVGVASTDEADRLSYFSNYGSVCTDLSAPGEYIPVAVPSDYGYYGTADGTSFSSPIVAGIAALIKSKHPDWNVEEIKYVLLDTARNIDDTNIYYSNKIGEGIPDVYAALTASKPDVSYTYNPHTDIEIEETNENIDIEVPDVDPITDEPEPIKDEIVEEDSAEKDSEAKPYTSQGTSFYDVWGHEYEEAIAYLENIGVIDGHPDGSFKPDDGLNRAEFSKIVMNAFGYNSYGSYCFPDVNDEWFSAFVCTAKDLGIIHGHSDGTFKPADPVNTVEALKIILETVGLEFYPMPGEEWFMPYVHYTIGTTLEFILYENGLDEPLTRGEAAEMIYMGLF